MSTTRPLALVFALAAFGGCRGNTPSPLPPISEHEQAVAERLRAHVDVLATEIGGRGVKQPEALEAAAQYIEQTWRGQGYTVEIQPFDVDGLTVRNIEVEKRGTQRPEEIVIVGAHYDTAWGHPGADDNGSGVAAMLEMSAALARIPTARTLRFVAFVNEEPPYFQTDAMGSLVYARRSAERGENIVGMFSLETIGYYDCAPGSQDYPKIVAPLYPDRGNFIAFVSNGHSRRFVKDVVARFSRSSPVPVEFIAATDKIPGIGWSDHWSFYEQGYPSVMVTDTAPNRNPHYHTARDVPEVIDYETLARVVGGVQAVVLTLARGEL